MNNKENSDFTDYELVRIKYLEERKRTDRILLRMMIILILIMFITVLTYFLL